MEKFKAYLTVDDWKTTDLLPPGWFYRQKRTERGFTYLNQMFEHFRTMIAMFDHLRQEGYGEEAVEKFEKGFRTLPMEPIPMKPIKTVNNEPEAKKNLAKKTKVKKEPVEKEIVKEVDTETMEALLKECDAEDAEDNMSEAEDEHTELGWEEEDEWLPPGWKVAAVKFGEVERRRYQSPCGKHFGGLADALAFLLAEGEGEEGIDCMTGGLALEGWVRVDGFSRAGWWSRLDAVSTRRFLSPQMEVLPGLKEVEVAMGIEGYSDEQVAQFRGLFENQGSGEAALGKLAQKLDDPLSSVNVKKEKALENSNKNKKIEDTKKTRKSPQTKRPANVALERPKAKEARVEVKKEKEDLITVKQERMEEMETLPKGWKRLGEGLVSPLGKRFASMVAAVEWMIQNKATSDQIYQVWMGLGSEGWGLATSTTSLLPGGWRMKWVGEVQDWHYLSRQCRILRSTSRARVELASSPDEHDAADLARCNVD